MRVMNDANVLSPAAGSDFIGVSQQPLWAEEPYSPPPEKFNVACPFSGVNIAQL